MATITSTQSGNFSSTSTWNGGVVPADGDRFDITSGHTVTLDSGMSVPTNGFADSYVYGILQSQASASMTLRMNGRLYVKGGGCLHLRDGATIQINGSSSERHGVWIENENATHVIMEGSDGMPCTTLSAAEAEGSTSLAVASGTNFAAGEWIAVFDHVSSSTSNTDAHPYANQDEGFWIHEVDGNTIYFRIFGGPTHVTVDRVSNSGERLFVSNAKVFREGQTIIFGTGSNRNIRTISSINYNRNRLTLNSAVTGTVTGETVYLTATEKPHTNGSKVRKVATVTTASATNTATSITVANANMFTANDEIWIEKRSEADSSTDHGGSQTNAYKHTIQSVSSNTITLDAAVGYNVVEGALVTRMTRNIVIETVATDGSDYGFLYREYDTDFNATCVIKDVYLKNMGNDDQNVDAGCVLRGRASTDNSPVSYTEQIPTRDREPWLEGIVCHNYPENTHRRDWGTIWVYDFRHAKLRCGLAMNGEDGISVHYEPGQAVYNSISVAGRDRAFRVEGNLENWEFAYDYGSRGANGLRALTIYEHGFGFHDVIIDGCSYWVTPYNSDSGLTFYRCRFTGNRYGVNTENSQTHLLYCYVKPLSGYPNVEAGTGTQQASSSYNTQFHRGLGGQPILSVEHNYEIDAIRLYSFNWEAYWDLEEKAWRCFRRHDNDNNPAMCERIYIPANTTVRVSGKCKLAPSFSGTYPYLFATDMTSNWNENQLDYATADSHKWSGKRYTQQFSTDAASAYEEEQITITSKSWPRQYLIGFYSSNRNAAEGFWLKDLQINIDKPYASPAFNLVNQCNKFSMIPTRVRSTFTEQKKRLGGRIF